jgi:hypothetical protein
MAAAVMLGAAACADILDVPDDPRLVASHWQCLDDGVELAPPERDEARVTVAACNFISTNCREPVTGLTASLCSKRDVNCIHPLRTGIVDVDGQLTFDVPTGGVLGVGFDGYLQVNAPSAQCTDEDVFGPAGPMLCGLLPSCDPQAPDEGCLLPTFAPAMLFFNPAIRADVERPIPLPLIPTAGVVTLTEAAGGAVDPTTGNVFITALDCDGRPAAGVRYSMMQHSNMSQVLYVSSGVISESASETDHSGIGGFLGVTAGFAGVKGSVSEGEGATATIGEVGVQVAPFTITYATLAPSRAP